MLHRLEHRTDPCRIDGLCRFQMIDACDPTHIGRYYRVLSARSAIALTPPDAETKSSIALRPPRRSSLDRISDKARGSPPSSRALRPASFARRGSPVTVPPTTYQVAASRS